ncbi:MAG: hypothetical protein OXE78_14280 [Gammaproteobacteria bacterium]|nr:hypothetical protein [Gammaproteobacteria bacterium]MCY4357175.1 hypothetical protein [Gammaproteobacteria bacterium]
MHALLNIGDFDNLLGHSVVGASWEGFVVENLLVASLSKGFHTALQDMRPDRSFFVHAGEDRYPRPRRMDGYRGDWVAENGERIDASQRRRCMDSQTCQLKPLQLNRLSHLTFIGFE